MVFLIFLVDFLANSGFYERVGVFCDIAADTGLLLYSKGEDDGCLSFLRKVCYRISGISREKETDIIDTDTVVGNSFSVSGTIFFSYIAVNFRIFLIFLVAEDRSVQAILHGIVFIAGADSKDRISAPGIAIASFLDGTVVIAEVDSFFPDIACYLFGDIPDILLNYPHSFKSFIYLYQITIDHEYR